MIDTTSHDDEKHPVRKILQSLNNVKAPEDFEIRLRKRLDEKRSEAPSFWESLSAIRRAPAYAFSALAIVIVSAIAYFSLMRTEVSPVITPQSQEARQEQSTRETPAPQTATSQPSSAGQPSSVAAGRTQTAEQPRETSSTGFRLDQPSTSASTRGTVQDEMQRRGLLREVGGSGIRSQQPAETSEVPILRAQPNAVFELYDSIAQSDSLKRDSLRRLLQRSQPHPEKEPKQQ